MIMGDIQNPSETSHYVTDAYYSDLMAAFTGWDDTDRLCLDPVVQGRAYALLYQEARYLDQGQFKKWLDLFAPQCAYWIPGTWNRGDPRREITFAFHDRRQLEDRVYRLETGYAWSQQPASRTSRLVSNIDTVHRVQQIDAAGFQIMAKQVNLLNCDQNIRNPSVTL